MLEKYRDARRVFTPRRDTERAGAAAQQLICPRSARKKVAQRLDASAGDLQQA
jgi:hypothetical protein